MDDAEQKLSEDAILWIKTNHKDIIDRFVGSATAATSSPISIFMAGSPGAGKTEFSIRLLQILSENHENIVRIDPDEVRNKLPMYVPGNAHIFQGAVSIAVEKIHDYVLHKNTSFLLDGTFSNLAKVRANVIRSLEKQRIVLIEYVYQDPLVAWDFTQKRELVEGRNIPKESFIEQLFSAVSNVDAIKSEFGDQVVVDLVRRNIQTNEYDMEFNVKTVAGKVLVGYSNETLNQQL